MAPPVLAGLGGLVVVLALPAVAGAATVNPLKPCYISTSSGTERVPVRGSGFTPGATVDIAMDGTVVEENVFVESDGSFGAGSAGIPAPHVARGQRAFTITVTEDGNPAHVARARTRVVALSFALEPSNARPWRRVRFTGAGFTEPGPVFAHYTFRGRLRRSVRIARPKGPCGSFAVKRRMIPIARPALGRWTLQIDQRRRYRPRPASSVWFAYTVHVVRRRA